MNTRDPRATVYEVDVPFLQLTDPGGHKHYLRAGNDLPEWVAPDTVRELLDAGVLLPIGVI